MADWLPASAQRLFLSCGSVSESPEVDTEAIFHFFLELSVHRNGRIDLLLAPMQRASNVRTRNEVRWGQKVRWSVQSGSFMIVHSPLSVRARVRASKDTMRYPALEMYTRLRMQVRIVSKRGVDRKQERVTDRGQSLCPRFSHSSTQFLWKVCMHGSTRI